MHIAKIRMIRSFFCLIPCAARKSVMLMALLACASVLNVQCSSSSPPPPRGFSYLTRPRTSVSVRRIVVVPCDTGVSQGDAQCLLPCSLNDLVKEWGREAFSPVGSRGEIRVVIKEASVKEIQLSDVYKGRLVVNVERYDDRQKLIGSALLSFESKHSANRDHTIADRRKVVMKVSEDLIDGLTRGVVGLSLLGPCAPLSSAPSVRSGTAEQFLFYAKGVSKELKRSLGALNRILKEGGDPCDRVSKKGKKFPGVDKVRAMVLKVNCRIEAINARIDTYVNSGMSARYGGITVCDKISDTMKLSMNDVVTNFDNVQQSAEKFGRLIGQVQRLQKSAYMLRSKTGDLLMKGER